MLFPNYIKKNHIILFVIIEAVLMLSGLVLLAKFCLLAFAVTFYLFRLGENSEQEDVRTPGSSDVVYSPACGKIIDISFKAEETEILLQVPWHMSYAIRAPIMAEVEDFKMFTVGQDIFRFSKIENFKQKSIPRSVAIRFIAGHDGLHSAGEVSLPRARITLKLIKCPFGLFPDLWVRQGDRCHRRSVIGVIPLGGTVSLSLPSNYVIIAKVGDMVLAGTTRIANINNGEGTIICVEPKIGK